MALHLRYVWLTHGWAPPSPDLLSIWKQIGGPLWRGGGGSWEPCLSYYQSHSQIHPPIQGRAVGHHQESKWALHVCHGPEVACWSQGPWETGSLITALLVFNAGKLQVKTCPRRSTKPTPTAKPSSQEQPEIGLCLNRQPAETHTVKGWHTTTANLDIIGLGLIGTPPMLGHFSKQPPILPTN